jgi:hypothetical protein
MLKRCKLANIWFALKSDYIGKDSEQYIIKGKKHTGKFQNKYFLLLK